MSDTNPVGRPPIDNPANVRISVNFTAAELARLDEQPGRSRRDKIMRAIDTVAAQVAADLWQPFEDAKE